MPARRNLTSLPTDDRDIGKIQRRVSQSHLIETLGYEQVRGAAQTGADGQCAAVIARKDAERDHWDYPVEAQLSYRLRDRYHQLHCEVENDREIPLPNRPLDQLPE